MTLPSPGRPARVLHPGRVLLALGLASVALVAWREPDFLRFVSVLRLPEDQGETAALAAAATASGPTPIERLGAAFARLEQARGELCRAWSAPGAGAQPIREPSDPRFVAYWEQRTRGWPEYRAAVEAFLGEAGAAGRDDPGNGIYSLAAGLAELDLALSPSGVDARLLGAGPPDEELRASWLRVDDRARLEAALGRIDAGLAAPELTSRVGERVRARLAGVEGVGPLDAFGQRALRVGAVFGSAPLLVSRSHVAVLARLALAERQQGGDGGAHLRRVRRIGLRLGSDAPTLLEMMVAYAVLFDADRAFLLHAAARGEAARALAAQRETVTLVRQQDRACNLEGLELSRLGSADALFMPAGGWRSAFDPALGRALDHAFVETGLVLALVLLGLLLLVPCAWNARRAEGACAWTVGDLLGVALPSFGAAVVLAILHARFAPCRAFGLAAPDAALAGAVQAAGLLGATWLVFRWRLRQAVLARHGLRFLRPGVARGALAAGLGAACAALLGVGPDALALAPAAVGLGLGALVLAWRGGVVLRAAANGEDDRAVRAHEGRVGLSTLGVALALVAVCHVVFTAPRRDALVRAYDAQVTALWHDEAATWGGGRPLQFLRELLERAPDAPP